MKKSSVKGLLIALGFIIFAAILLFLRGDENFRNASALTFLMIYFWVLEIIPIYVTSLFPLIFAIPLGLATGDDLARSYADSIVFLFLGGFIMALALEKWNIHLQISKAIIRLVGSTKSRIILGFLCSTAFLSMWISNTATALMMLPMGLAVIKTLPDSKENKRFSILLLLSIAYAASIGGVATLIGSPPNSIMAAILKKDFQIEVDFFTWMKYGFPLCVIFLAAVYLLFNLLLGKSRKDSIADFSVEKTSWDKNQIRVGIVFSALVILWIFRAPIINLTGIQYSDQNAALFCAAILFLLPSTKEEEKILEWKDTKNIPWGILYLFGGGLALAEILESGGIIDLISNSFEVFLPYGLFILIICAVAITIFGSEMISNTALATITVPIIAKFALNFDYSLIQLAFAVTMGASCAFMLPMGTPPNAIVFSSGHIKMRDMIKIGFVLNIISMILISLFTYLFVK